MLSNQFQGVVINVSFPRSGHRFLRELCLAYFSDEMRFFNSYSQNTDTDVHLQGKGKSTENYIKTHDFDLQGFDVLKEQFPLRRKYIVQVRHPLESIASYYEFALKTKEVKQDTEGSWLIFFKEKLDYWKRFCETWLGEESATVLLVTYERLYHCTELELSKVVQFITCDQRIDQERLSLLSEQKSFNQYVAEEDSAKSKKREISDFKYFDKASFSSIEDELFGTHLCPLGISRLLP